METSIHKFIQKLGTPKKGLNTEAGFMVINHYLAGAKYSRDKWRKEKRFFNVNYNMPNGSPKQSKPVNYLLIAEYIRTQGVFIPAMFDLPEMKCFWLDESLDMKINFHMSDHTGVLGMISGIPQQQYGDRYPIRPQLNREGHLYTTFQPQLIARIVRLREKLIENSNLAMEDDWVFDLRTLVSDTISLVDITLTQFYIKAEYDPLPNWKFDKIKIGERHGRRLNDKLKWIYQITGNNLNIEPELNSFNSLKDLRNHLMHFDPPSLVITIEEATIWLNQIIDIGLILIKIRKAIGAEISSSLVNFILQKEAQFIPRNIRGNRAPLHSKPKEDYNSSIW